MIFTDMDGVVAVYDRNGFIEDKDDNMPFMEPGIHYFESRDPDTRIIDAYELISRDHQFFVLSNIVDDPTVSEEHESDKKKWVKKHMPFVDTDDQLLVIKEPKYKAAERLLNRKLDRDSKTSRALTPPYEMRRFPIVRKLAAADSARQIATVRALRLLPEALRLATAENSHPATPPTTASRRNVFNGVMK